MMNRFIAKSSEQRQKRAREREQKKDEIPHTVFREKKNWHLNQA